MKKQYLKPSMKVYSLHQQAALLTTSNDWPVAYMPGIADDKHQLA